jgi:hypothetical protein
VFPRRNPKKTLHPVESLLAQRIYGLIMGYEDLNDHEELRHDPMFTLALGKNISQENEVFTLAGKSTLNRIEHCPENVEQGAESRQPTYSIIYISISCVNSSSYLTKVIKYILRRFPFFIFAIYVSNKLPFFRSLSMIFFTCEKSGLKKSGI